MSHPRRPDLSALSSQFHRAVAGLTHEWGFVVVRTAYHDEARWADALNKLRAYALPDDDGAEMDPETFALPVVADRDALDGANFATVRVAFAGWVDAFLGREQSSNDDEDWPSDVRRDVFVIVDGPSLASLVDAPEHVPGSVPDLDLEPWVVVVDSKDPATLPYRGGGPYTGFMRVPARVLAQLAEDLDSRTMGRLCPVREYDGQIPLYDGRRGRLVDPPEGVYGRYRFPRGTPRGEDGARAMLEEIQRAIGHSSEAGP